MGHFVYMVTTNWQDISSKTFSIENGIKVFWGSLKFKRNEFFVKTLSFFFVIYNIFITNWI